MQFATKMVIFFFSKHVEIELLITPEILESKTNIINLKFQTVKYKLNHLWLDVFCIQRNLRQFWFLYKNADSNHCTRTFV